MDPLAISAAASSLVVMVVKIGKEFATIYEKYQNAQRTIFFMQTECTTLAAALAQVQLIFASTPPSQLQRFPDSLIEALDLSMLGCSMTLSVLAKEFEGFAGEISAAGALKKKKKVVFVWKEETMTYLLEQLRGQRSALMLLLEALNSTSIERMLHILESGRCRSTLHTVKKYSESIRTTHPAENYPDSILDISVNETQSLYSLAEPDAGEHQPPIFYDYQQIPIRQSKSAFPSAATSSRQPPPVPSKPSSLGVSSSSGPLPAVGSSELDHQRNHLVNPSLDSWALTTQSQMETALDRVLAEYTIPSIAVGVLKDQQSELHIRGIRKQGYKTPVCRTDMFCISACSGVMTMTVLAIFIERGAIQWHTTLSEALPRFSNVIHASHHETTLEMCGAHVSGMTAPIHAVDGGGLWSYLNAKNTDGLAGRRAAALSFLKIPPDVKPGTQYTWHFVNVLIVALVLEEHTGLSWEHIMKKELFDPLEMYHTGFGPPDCARNSIRREPTQPWSHCKNLNGVVVPTNPAERGTSNPVALQPADGIHSSIPDILAFLTLHLDATGTSTSTRPSRALLGPTSSQKLHGALFPGTSSTAGGWLSMPRAWAKGDALYIGGNSGGFSGSFWLAPASRQAFVCVVNVDGYLGGEATDEGILLCTRLEKAQS